MGDATLVLDSIGLDATVASAGGGAVTIEGPISGTMPMVTVLPRVEVMGQDAVRHAEVPRQRRYEATRRLGEGGLGEVLFARDNDIGREVAVKRMRREVKSPAALARFADEVRTIGRLEHPNIVPIHDVGVDENGDYYFVMKYVEGETLESIIDKLAAGDPLMHAHYGFERRVQMFISLLEAVAFAHSKGIVHRDIKPANVMVGAYGEVMLMDWGIAKRVREADGLTPPRSVSSASTPSKRGALFETRAGELVGTPAYMAPEQARGEVVDERSDVYALSVLFYELLALKHPLAEKNTLAEMLHAISHEPIGMAGVVSSPHQASPPMDLSWFLRKGLEKNPAKRYASVGEMIARLERRAEGHIPVQCHITLMMRMTAAWLGFVRRHPIIVSLAMLGFVALFVASVIAFATRVLSG